MFRWFLWCTCLKCLMHSVYIVMHSVYAILLHVCVDIQFQIQFGKDSCSSQVLAKCGKKYKYFLWMPWFSDEFWLRVFKKIKKYQLWVICDNHVSQCRIMSLWSWMKIYDYIKLGVRVIRTPSLHTRRVKKERFKTPGTGIPLGPFW